MKTKPLEEEIIDYFRTNRENTVPAISRRFNVHKYRVNKIIDKYLKSRENERKKSSSTR